MPRAATQKGYRHLFEHGDLLGQVMECLRSVGPALGHTDQDQDHTFLVSSSGNGKGAATAASTGTTDQQAFASFDPLPLSSRAESWALREADWSLFVMNAKSVIENVKQRRL